jgi:hypothetical protein
MLNLRPVRLRWRESVSLHRFQNRNLLKLDHFRWHGVEDQFSTTAKLRNTTGHNLVWDNIFSAPAKYEDLFHQVMNALLYVIALKWP